MVIREFGTEHKQHLLFFQGSCEPWIHFTPSTEALAKHFHVVLLTPDGHDPEEHKFAERVFAFLLPEEQEP